MKLQKQLTMVISTDREYQSMKEKRASRLVLLEMLEKFSVSKAIGSYRGKVERSFIMLSSDQVIKQKKN